MFPKGRDGGRGSGRCFRPKELSSCEVSEVVKFMREIGLSQYSDVLLKHGFDDLEVLMDVQDSHLKAMGFLPGHMLKIKKRLKQQGKSSVSPNYGEDPPVAVCTASTSKLSGDFHIAAVPSSDVLEVVRKSWTQVEGQVLDIAKSLYQNLFVLAPDVRKLFPLSVRNRYRDWSCAADEVENDFENSSALPLIWSKVIYAVGSSISGLKSNPSKFVLNLKALGLRHAGYNVKEEHFLLVGEALVLALRHHLDQGFTYDVEQAWRTVYDFIASAAQSGLEDLQSSRHPATAVKPGPGPGTSRPVTLLRSRTTPGWTAKPKLAPRQPAVVAAAKVVSRPTSPPTLTTSVPASIPLGVVPSQRVILTVQQSWIAVKDLGIANVGELLYKHMFRIAPVTKELFPVSVRMRYRDWTSSAQEVEGDFDNSPALRNLFAKVVEAVGTAVAGLHNISRLVFELNALGMRHINYNMQEEYFAYGGQALVLTLQDGLGAALSDEIKEAWIAVYEFISANIISGLRFAREKENLLKKLQMADGQDRSSWSTTGASAASAGSEDSFDDP